MKDKIMKILSKNSKGKNTRLWNWNYENVADEIIKLMEEECGKAFEEGVHEVLGRI